MNVISLEHQFFSTGPSTRNLKDSVDDSKDRVRLSCIHHGLKNHELNAIKCFLHYCFLVWILLLYNDFYPIIMMMINC